MPDVLLDRLRAAAEAQGAYLYMLTDPDALLVLEVVLDQADCAEGADPAYGRELASRRRPVADIGPPAGAALRDARLRVWESEGGHLARQSAGTSRWMRAGALADLADDSATHADLTECWLHGSRFDLVTGRPTGPPATAAVPVYPVRVRAGDVEVALPAPLGAGAR